ncbi:oxidoreductase C-terminal domain-containing protein [Streptomyces thermocarboxydus]
MPRQPLAGSPTPLGAVPWFWSDQADVKLQIAGLSAGHDSVVVRGGRPREFLRPLLPRRRGRRGERRQRPRDYMLVKRILDTGGSLPMDRRRGHPVEGPCGPRGLMRASGRLHRSRSGRRWSDQPWNGRRTHEGRSAGEPRPSALPRRRRTAGVRRSACRTRLRAVRGAEVVTDGVGVEHDVRVVLGRVLELLQVVQSECLKILLIAEMRRAGRSGSALKCWWIVFGGT